MKCFKCGKYELCADHEIPTGWVVFTIDDSIPNNVGCIDVGESLIFPDDENYVLCESCSVALCNSLVDQGLEILEQ